ncbi:MAG TPA: PEGA domain-containing protein, partial [Polyangiaceae bacterium]|nr:PEGA domain-containing protein [Polyangiaceae bacterium]
EGEGLRATPSQVGRCVAELFAAERAELSAAIAARLAQGTPGEAPGGVAAPVASVASSAGALPEQGASVASAGAASGSAAFGSSSAPGSAAFDPSAAAPGEAAPALSDEGAARALAALSSEDAANALAGRPAGGPLAWLRAWGAPAAAALVLAALVLAARSGSRLWGGAKVPEEYAPGELRAPPAGSLVLRVVAAPPNARVLVDGRPLQHGVVNFAQGEVRHRLSIEAPDHEPYADWVTLREARTTLRVTLQPTPTKGSAPAAEVVLEESPGG